MTYLMKHLYPMYFKWVQWTTVPFIRESCSNCGGILFPAWFDTERISRLCFCLFFFFFNHYLNAPWCFLNTCFFFCPWVCALSCMHLATIFPSVWRISSLVNMCLCPEPASLGHVRHDSELLLQPWGIPLSMTSEPTFISQKKKKWKRGERKSSRLPKVKWIDFKHSWAAKLSVHVYNIRRQGQSVSATLFTRSDTP